MAHLCYAFNSITPASPPPPIMLKDISNFSAILTCCYQTLLFLLQQLCLLAMLPPCTSYCSNACTSIVVLVVQNDLVRLIAYLENSLESNDTSNKPTSPRTHLCSPLIPIALIALCLLVCVCVCV